MSKSKKNKEVIEDGAELLGSEPAVVATPKPTSEPIGNHPVTGEPVYE